MKLGDNVSSAWDQYLGTTSSDWSKSAVLDTTIVTGGASSNVRRCRATSGRVEVCNAAYGNTGWLGLAQIWISGLHITQGLVKVNDTYFNTGTYNTPAWRNLVMCQEVGHTLGLDHQDENFSNANLNTCMDYTSNPDSNQHPNQHDYDELALIYSHTDSTTTVKQTLTGKMPPAMADIDFSGPAQWGKLIRSSHGGWTELYELDFGGGHKVFTHVIWATAEEEGADREHGQR
ncbi:MAG: hypothetical protein ACREJ6_03195 [Candidatus Methylomirabilis sp.]